ncbi:hypothetical protein NQZ68_027681 [Dissostichus eleginoides]|nr:hypothetical protein NQZ68_027681 [Dissostichus eleginoides]
MHSLLVGGMAPKRVSRGVGRVQGAQSMTNQHPERAARWAFWIICCSGRPCQWPTNRNKEPLGEHCGRHKDPRQLRLHGGGGDTSGMDVEDHVTQCAQTFI